MAAVVRSLLAHLTEKPVKVRKSQRWEAFAQQPKVGRKSLAYRQAEV